MPKPTTQDLADFIQMFDEQMPWQFADYVKDCLRRNPDPRTLAAAFETAAHASRSWCIGRFS